MKKGKLEGSSKDEVMEILKSRNITVLELKKLNSIWHKEIYIKSPISSKDFVLLLREFSTLIEAGIPIIDAVHILIQQTTSKPLSKVLNSIKELLSEGVSLSEAFNKYPKFFPLLLVQMTRVGEVSGNLDVILDQMATYYEKQYELKQKVKTALAYPLLVSLFSIVVSFILLVFIVPVFEDLFRSYDQELPLYTKMVLQASEIGKKLIWFLPVMIFIVIGFLIFLDQNSKLAYRFDYLTLKIPIIGPFLTKIHLTRMSQTLGSLLHHAVPILQAIQTTENVVQNRVIKKILHESYQAVEKGESMTTVMRQTSFIPPLIMEMIAVGERTRSLDQMLYKLSTFYEKEIDDVANKLKALLEPFLILFLAGIVGVIMLAVVIPMFQMFEFM